MRETPLTLDEVIAALQEIRAKHGGNLPVYMENEEYGPQAVFGVYACKAYGQASQWDGEWESVPVDQVWLTKQWTPAPKGESAL